MFSTNVYTYIHRCICIRTCIFTLHGKVKQYKVTLANYKGCEKNIKQGSMVFSDLKSAPHV